METNKEKIRKLMKLVELKDSDYFSYLINPPDSKYTWKLIKEPFRGIFIDVPGKLDFSKNASFPLMVWKQITDSRTWEVAFELNSTIVVSDLHSGEVFCGNPYTPPRGKRYNPDTYFRKSKTGMKPEGDAADAFVSGPDFKDLANVFEREWVSSSYAITVINYDFITNTVVTEVAGTRQKEGSGYFPESLIRIVLDENERRMEASAGYGLRKTGQSPVVSDPGAAVRVKKEGGSLLVYGSVKIKLPKAMIVPPLKSGDKYSPDVPQAFIRCLLLCNQLDIFEKKMIEIFIPIYSGKTFVEGEVVEGYFNLDAKEQFGQDIQDDSLFYLVACESIAMSEV